MVISNLDYLEVVTEESSIVGGKQSNSSVIYQSANAGNNDGQGNTSIGNTAINIAIVNQINVAALSFNKSKSKVGKGWKKNKL